MSRTTPAPWIPVASFGLALAVSLAAGSSPGLARFRAPAASTSDLECKSDLTNMNGVLTSKNFVGNHKNPDKAHGQVSIQETCDYSGGVVRDSNPKTNSNDIHFSGKMTFTFEVTDNGGQSVKTMTIPLTPKKNPSPDKLISYVGEGSTPGLQAEFESKGQEISTALKNLTGQLAAGGSAAVIPKEWWTQISASCQGVSGCTESGQAGPCAKDSIVLNLFLEPDADGDGKKEGSVNN